MSGENSDQNIVVLNTCPDEAVARELAAAVVEAGLAACVNINPGLSSVYRWQGEVQCEPECLLIIKSRRSHYAALERLIVERHPYELPEVIAVPIVAGLPGYLAWLGDSLGDTLGDPDK